MLMIILTELTIKLYVQKKMLIELFDFVPPVIGV